MKKHLLFYFLLFIMPVCFAQTIDGDYALLRIYRGSGSDKDSVKVKVYNQVPFNVPPNTVVNFKIYSKGGFVITARNGSNVNGYNGWYDYTSNYSGPSWFLTFEPGKVVCMIASPFAGNNMLKEIDEKAFNKKVEGKGVSTIDLEEDKDKPIKGGGAVTSSKSGTGFLISTKGYIVTNSHVVDKAKNITVRGIGGDFTTKYPADIVVDDKTNDIVVLKLDASMLVFDQIPYAIRTTGVETAEEIFVLGYPLKKSMGEEIKLTTGVVSSKSGYEGTFSTYQVSASVQPGNSGSPLFDKNGNLIGIINAKLKGTESVSYAIKISYLVSLLQTSETPSGLIESTSTSSSQLVDLVKSYSSYVYIIETEK